MEKPKEWWLSLDAVVQRNRNLKDNWLDVHCRLAVRAACSDMLVAGLLKRHDVITSFAVRNTSRNYDVITLCTRQAHAPLQEQAAHSIHRATPIEASHKRRGCRSLLDRFHVGHQPHALFLFAARKQRPERLRFCRASRFNPGPYAPFRRSSVPHDIHRMGVKERLEARSSSARLCCAQSSLKRGCFVMAIAWALTRL